MGGWSGSALKSTEVVPSITDKNCGFPPLPTVIDESSLILTQNQDILLCGGSNNEKTCLEMKQKNWEHHSNLYEKRRFASAVSMPTGVFIFGGDLSKTTWEWLPSGTKVWKNGGTIHGSGFKRGCAVQTSKNEIVIIGGLGTKNQVLKFNIESKKWTNYGNVLKQGRFRHSCVFFDNQIIVSGGYNSGDLSSTEIIDIHDLTTSKLKSNMVKARAWHGLVVAHVQNKLSVLAIGGKSDNGYTYHDSVEIWNPTTETWTISDMKLSEAKEQFGYASVPTHLVCS